MASKYCRHGETYDGDGTTSSAAASDGAAGAWNDFLDVAKGSTTYGSVDPGDTVYVKTTQSDDSSDVTVTVTADAILQDGTNATSSGMIVYQFDDGTTWSGAQGDFYFKGSSSSGINITYGDFTRWQADPTLKNLILGSAYVGTTEQEVHRIDGTHLTGFKIEMDDPTTATSTRNKILFFGDAPCILENFEYECKGRYTSAGELFFKMSGSAGHIILRNFKLNYTGPTPLSASYVMDNGSTQGTMEMIAGEITGLPSDCYLMDDDSYPQIDMIGVKADYANNYTVKPRTSELSSADSSGGIVRASIPGTKHEFINSNCMCSSRWVSENLPVLNATLPDTTGWSIKTYPWKVSKSHPWSIMQGSKIWNATASDVKITVNILLSQAGLDSSTDSDIYLVVSYMDNTSGDMKYVTTQDLLNPTALTASTASWSSTFYGASNFTKKKIEVTTAFDVKEDTEIFYDLIITKRAVSTEDILFVCPDVLLEAV